VKLSKTVSQLVKLFHTFKVPKISRPSQNNTYPLRYTQNTHTNTHTFRHPVI
jgi:hypothetical protein